MLGGRQRDGRWQAGALPFQQAGISRHEMNPEEWEWSREVAVENGRNSGMHPRIE